MLCGPWTGWLTHILWLSQVAKKPAAATTATERTPDPLDIVEEAPTVNVTPSLESALEAVEVEVEAVEVE